MKKENTIKNRKREETWAWISGSHEAAAPFAPSDMVPLACPVPLEGVEGEEEDNALLLPFARDRAERANSRALNAQSKPSDTKFSPCSYEFEKKKREVVSGKFLCLCL